MNDEIKARGKKATELEYQMHALVALSGLEFESESVVAATLLAFRLAWIQSEYDKDKALTMISKCINSHCAKAEEIFT